MTIVVPQGGADRYLMKKYKTQDSCSFNQIPDSLWVCLSGGTAWLCALDRRKFPSEHKARVCCQRKKIHNAHRHLLRIQFSDDMEPGSKFLRVWQLSFRSDFGMPGMADPFDMCTLIELVLTQGFRDLKLFICVCNSVP